MGCPAPIVHGLCTMAFASRAVVAAACGGRLARLRRLAVRFSNLLHDAAGPASRTTLWPAGGDGARGWFGCEADGSRWDGRDPPRLGRDRPRREGSRDVTDQVSHLDVGAPWSVCTSRTVIDHLVRDVDRHPTAAPLFFEEGLVVGRTELLDLCERFAGYLKSRVRPGDRSASLSGNRAEYFIALLAIFAIRAIVVSINPQAKEHDASHVLADSAPVLAGRRARQPRAVRRDGKGVPSVRELICLDGPEPRGLLPAGANGPRLDFAHADCRRDDITTVYYTSGTTGPPKGCMLDHGWWLRIVDVDLRHEPRGRGARVLLVCRSTTPTRPSRDAEAPDRRGAGGDAPVQRLPLLGRGQPVRRHRRCTRSPRSRRCC